MERPWDVGPGWASIRGAGGGGSGTGVPGVGPGEGANVRIPCGVAVLLDVPSLHLTHLLIQGLLRVEDSPTQRRSYAVHAAFITVQGRLAAGTPAEHLRARLAFVLEPNGASRTPLTVQGLAYADKFQRVDPQPDTADVGHKAFAVVGGQVELYGMPGGEATPSWVRLAATVRAGDSSLLVDADVVGTWPVGGLIVLASTDFDRKHSEQRTIVGWRREGVDRTLLLVDRAFSFAHWGDPTGLPDGFGGFVDERAEVALLSRNIVVVGRDEAAPYDLEGGHFVVFQTQTPQHIEGVEFFMMGQQGTLGRYNIHFHVCGDTQGLSTVRKNSMHQSKQRGVVLHATHNVTVEGTVAWNSTGHTFMVEEGGEQDNTFLANLGITTNYPKLIPGPTETDMRPSMFWLSNFKNHLIDNVAVGSANSGFWTEREFAVRGMSLFIPELRDMDPRDALGGRIEGCVAHSNAMFGFQTYPRGIRGAVFTPNGTEIVRTTIQGLRAYHNLVGLLLNGNNYVTVEAGVFADNVLGMDVKSNAQGTVKDCRFVGMTLNFGPSPCETLPFGGDFVMSGNSTQLNCSLVGVFGVVVSGFDYGVPHVDTLYSNLRFSKYASQDMPAAAFTVPVGKFQGRVEAWNSNTALRGIQVELGSSPVWFPPWDLLPEEVQERRSNDLVLWDQDGSLVGGSGGFLVVNTPQMLPPAGEAQHCSALPRSNAAACQGLCYRTVAVSYEEPGWDDPFQNITHGNGEFSYLEVVREEDGVRTEVYGNLNHSISIPPDVAPGTTRWFSFVLLTGISYTLRLQPGSRDPRFWPANMTFSFVDVGHTDPCPGAVTFRVLGQGQAGSAEENRAFRAAGVRALSWQAYPSPSAFFSACPGVQTASASWWPVQYVQACYFEDRILVVRLTDTMTGLVLLSTAQDVPSCAMPRSCGVFPSGGPYSWRSSENFPGAEALPNGDTVPFGSPLFTESPEWVEVPTPAGYYSQDRAPALARFFSPKFDFPTLYFRRHFTVESLQCYSAVELQYYPVFGLAVYLNGVEVFRFNLPRGPLSPDTYSLQVLSPLGDGGNMVSARIPLGTRGAYLRRGVNLLAYEVHAPCSTCKDLYFDSQVSLEYNC